LHYCRIFILNAPLREASSFVLSSAMLADRADIEVAKQQ
jgi:hypothetical protein